MELVTFLLVVIIFELWGISEKLRSKQEISQPQINTSFIEEKLDKIFIALNGPKKEKSYLKIKRQKLKKRALKAMKDSGVTGEESFASIEKAFADAKNESEKDGYSFKYDSIERWVDATEKENEMKSLYGDKLEKAKSYLKNVITIHKYDKDMQEFLKVDMVGVTWLTDKLEGLKLIEPVKEWDSELEQSFTKEWKVV